MPLQVSSGETFPYLNFPLWENSMLTDGLGVYPPVVGYQGPGGVSGASGGVELRL